MVLGRGCRSWSLLVLSILVCAGGRCHADGVSPPAQRLVLKSPPGHAPSGETSRKYGRNNSRALDSFPHVVPFDFCQQMLSQVPHTALNALRDHIQLIQRHDRVRNELHQFLWHKQYPTTDPAQQYAYGSPLSIQQLEADTASAMQAAKIEMGKLRALVKALLDARQLNISSQYGDFARVDLRHMQVLSSCVMGRLNPNLYPHRPVVSFMLQYFKRPWIIQPLVERLQACRPVVPCELLVNADNPSEAAVWGNLTANSDRFLRVILSNNVHETRAYNRLSQIATGSILIVLQDDQLMPIDCSYLERLVKVFAYHPTVAAVGMHTYRYSQFRRWFRGRPMEPRVSGSHFKDPTSQLNVQYVQFVDFAPLAIRKSALHHVGGLDETMGDAGECGITTDWELSMRFWMAGWQVMWMELEGVDGDPSGNPSGTHLVSTSGRCWDRQHQVAAEVMNKRYSAALHEWVHWHIRGLNLVQLQRLQDTPCPYFTDGCEMNATDPSRSVQRRQLGR